MTDHSQNDTTLRRAGFVVVRVPAPPPPPPPVVWHYRDGEAPPPGEPWYPAPDLRVIL